MYIPKGITDSIFLPQHYPVVYLLDAEVDFTYLASLLQRLNSVNAINGNRVCPEMIIVGIPNTKNTLRTRDLTPTKDSISAPLAGGGGGGEQFMSFIEKELMPYIDSNYPTSPYKLLIGHSFGGLTVMNTLINHTQLFNSYICIDPSLWWDKQNLLKASKSILSQKSFAGKTMYLGIANTMEKGMNINDVANDTSKSTLHIRSILEMDKYIKNQNPKGLTYSSKYYENDNHGSVAWVSEYDGLRFIFKQYPIELSAKEYDDSTIDVANRYTLHFNKISELFGYKVMLPENQLNAMAYRFLGMKQFKKAEECFKLYINSYPKSFNAYNAYGDYFVTTGNKPKAIEYFKKALALRKYPMTLQKLNKLLE